MIIEHLYEEYDADRVQDWYGKAWNEFSLAM